MLTELLRYGRGRGIDWHVLFFEDGHLTADVQSLGIPTHLVSPGRLRHPLRFIRTVRRIASIARSISADLILSWSAKPHLYGSLAGWWTNIPTAWYQLGFPHGRHLSMIDRLATALPALGVFTLSEISTRSQAALWPKRPTHLVYPSVDLTRFDPDTLASPSRLREQLGLPMSGPLIGIIGRLQRWKGMHTLLQAMPQILSAYPNAHCVIVGGQHAMEPDYPELLRGIVHDTQLEAHVTFAGFQKNIPDWMQAMDVVVHASDHEPFGIVVIEAMALGKPVVAGASGGPPEIVTEGKDGLLARFGDPNHLSAQILRYLDDPAFAAKIGRQARNRAQFFSPHQYAERFLTALTVMMKGDPPARTDGPPAPVHNSPSILGRPV
jgi:glycosyltransferase involved in cell wall biosynthesis